MLSAFDQLRRLGIISEIDDCLILDAPNRFINHKKRHHEPFTRHDCATETIKNFNIKSGGIKYSVNEILEFGPVDVEELVGSDHLDIGSRKVG